VPAETVTIVAAQVDGVSALGPAPTDGHDDGATLVRAIASSAGGRPLPEKLGGLAWSFTSAMAAIHAAEDMQRAATSSSTRAPGATSPLRIGIATGDAEFDEGGYTGRPVTEARLLCDGAAPGTIVVTDLVRLLSASRGSHSFHRRGEIEGVDGGERLVVHEVRWASDDPDPEWPRLPLPGLLTVEETVPFVARSVEWAELESVWDSTMDGHRHLVLLGGEAGAGKTRLVTEFARSVHERGAMVLYGVCSDDVELPYQPFAEALAHAFAFIEDDRRQWLAGDGVVDLARLLPHFFADRSPHVELDPATQRYRLFEAIVGVLANLARRDPVFLVLDDVHWARRPTIQLLEHIIRSARLHHICLVATYRTTPTDMSEAFHEALPDLRRRPGAHRLVLGRFDREGVMAFAEAMAGHELDQSHRRLIDGLLVHTEGNPFLLGELWRHLVEQGRLGRLGNRLVLAGRIDDISSPETVREVVGQRLAALPEATRAVLELAAVAGPVFELSLIAAAASITQADALDAIEPALAAHLVEDTGADRFRFAHALVRRAAEDGLSPAKSRHHHLAIARAMEAGGSADLDELAHHVVKAVPLASASEAIALARRAAAKSMAAVAHDNAAVALAKVMPLATGRPERIDLLIEFGAARMRSGHAVEGLRVTSEAADLARSIADHERFIRATLTAGEAMWRGAVHGAGTQKLVAEALSVAPDDITRAELLACGSGALAFSGRDDEALSWADEALAIGRAQHSDRTIKLALESALFAHWTPSTINRQLAYANELIDLATTTGDEEALLYAYDKLMVGLTMLGRLDELRRVLNLHGRLARQLNQPLFQLLDVQVRAMVALNDGLFEEAEALAEEGATWKDALPNAAGGYGVQMFGLRREQGRLDEVRPQVEVITRLGHEAATWKPGLAALHAELGSIDRCAELLAELVADDLGAIPRDSLWPAALSYLAEACRATGDGRAAAQVYDHLLPYAGFNITVSGGMGWYGAADRYLGMLAEVGRRSDEALQHFEAALRFDRRLPSPTWTAHSCYELGRFLATKGPRHRERAETLLHEATAIADRLGMTALATRCDAVRPLEHPATPVVTTSLTARELSVLALIATGKTNRDIGRQLHLSEHTVANHVRAILLKTGSGNRTEAASWALREGVVDGSG
jgi:DNA-binding CsgD family transcriptional regulator